MTGEIAVILGQDGMTNGAIYALLAIALVLVYAVTRVVFIPQGEFVAYGALTAASLQQGQLPATAWLLVTLGAIAAVTELWTMRHTLRFAAALKTLAFCGLLPALILLAAWSLAPLRPPASIQILLTLALVVPLGPFLYRIVFQPVANASVLLLLIIAVAVSFALVGLGLLMFGAEGVRTAPLSAQRFELGAMTVSGQSLCVIAASVALMVAFYAFGRTLLGKALRATAINRVGARLSGIRTELAGGIAFTCAAAIGALSGILIAPLTTVYYDSGFLVGLKGFVAAIIGGLVSYPIAVAGALLVGLLESFSSFWASAFKEVLVFTLIIPVLIWRSLTSLQIDEDEE